jgi:hypothetical protein
METQLVTTDSTRENALQYARRIFAEKPGFGNEAERIVTDLAESEVSTAVIHNLIELVSNQQPIEGRTNKLNYLSQAVGKSYDLDNVANNPTTFRRFIADLHDIEYSRREMAEAGVSISYRDAFFLFHEANLSPETVMDYLTSIEGKEPDFAKVSTLIDATKEHMASGHTIDTIIDRKNHLQSMSCKRR